MKDLVLQYARYNVWANKLMIDTMLKLDEATLDKDITSSFTSIRQTVYHSWGAEHIWLQRLELAENPIWIPRTFTGTFVEACADWQNTSQKLLQFTDKQFDDKAFSHIVLYYDMQKNHHKSRVGRGIATCVQSCYLPSRAVGDHAKAGRRN
jgi:uncharacterized damage-inducible protein DinB